MTDQTENHFQIIITKLQNIRKKCNLTNIDLQLPQLCVIGDQSSGKSTTLEALTNVRFPVNHGTCTKCPIVVECKNDKNVKTDTFYIKKSQLPDSKEYDFVSVNEDGENGDDFIIPIDKLEQTITDIQENLLKHSSVKFTSTEISIKVVGPDQMDIILVDLPGIIHNGNGKQEVNNLINDQIKKPTSLILVCYDSTADIETQHALELVKNVDQFNERTCHILTKYDRCLNSDQDHNKQICYKKINEDESKELGIHGIACRPDGRTIYNESAESDIFKKCNLENNKHAGIQKLKERLPDIFAKLIKTNIPILKEDIQKQLKECKEKLEEIGETEPTQNDIIRRFKIWHDLDIIQLRKQLTPILKTFTNDIKKLKLNITKEWISENYEHDAWDAPFFQGKETFNKCTNKIANDWWKSVQDQFIKQILTYIKDWICDDTYDIDKEQNINFSKQFRQIVNQEFETNFEIWQDSFNKSCKEILKWEKDFNTINHYLTSKYQEYMILPEEVKEDFIESITAVDIVKHTLSKYYTSNKSHSIDTDQIKIDEYKEHVSKLLNNALEKRTDDFNKLSLEDQNLERVYHAVQANYDVEFKTYPDNMMRVIRTNLFEPLEIWLNDMDNNPVINKYAKEDIINTKLRKELKEKIKLLNDVILEIKDINVN